MEMVDQSAEQDGAGDWRAQNQDAAQAVGDVQNFPEHGRILDYVAL